VAAAAGGRRDRRPRQFFAGLREALIEFAAHQFRLDKPRGDGSTDRQHLQAVAERSPAAAEQLAGPPLPAAIAHVWAWFCQLDAGRGGGGFGPTPLSWGTLDAWARLTRTRPTAFEVHCLLALDGQRLMVIAEKAGG
jgi:hypothetical protein